MFIKKHKFKFVIFVLLTGLFFLIRFPYEEALAFALKKALGPGGRVQFHYDDFYFTPAGPGLVFKNPRIQIGARHHLKADWLKAAPSYKALFKFKPGVVFVLTWKNNQAEITLRSSRYGRARSAWAFTIEALNFNPEVLRSAVPLFSKVSGRLSFKAQLLWDPEYQESPEGYWSVKGRGLQVRSFSYTFPGTIGTMSLPSFQWEKVHSFGEIKKGVFLIKDTVIGGGKDAFQMRVRGEADLNWHKRPFSSRPGVRLNHYDLALEILTDKDLQSKLYFLDLFLSSVETKTERGTRYLARIKGNKVNFFNLSRADKLASLKEIQNPDEKP